MTHIVFSGCKKETWKWGSSSDEGLCFFFRFESWEKITFKRISYFVRAKLSMEIQKKGFKGSFLSFFDWNGKSQKKLLCDRPILPGNYFAVSHIYLLFLFVKLLSCLLCPYIVYLLQLLSPCLDPSGGVQKYFSIPKLQIFLLHFVSWKFGNMH